MPIVDFTRRGVAKVSRGPVGNKGGRGVPDPGACDVVHYVIDITKERYIGN